MRKSTRSGRSQSTCHQGVPQMDGISSKPRAEKLHGSSIGSIRAKHVDIDTVISRCCTTSLQYYGAKIKRGTLFKRCERNTGLVRPRRAGNVRLRVLCDDGRCLRASTGGWKSEARLEKRSQLLQNVVKLRWRKHSRRLESTSLVRWGLLLRPSPTSWRQNHRNRPWEDEHHGYSRTRRW
jgi:hypothetical protein